MFSICWKRSNWQNSACCVVYIIQKERERESKGLEGDECASYPLSHPSTGDEISPEMFLLPLLLSATASQVGGSPFVNVFSLLLLLLPFLFLYYNEMMKHSNQREKGASSLEERTLWTKTRRKCLVEWFTSRLPNTSPSGSLLSLLIELHSKTWVFLFHISRRGVELELLCIDRYIYFLCVMINIPKKKPFLLSLLPDLKLSSHRPGYIYIWMLQQQQTT